MEDTKRIVEINGVKIEVDLRTAKRVDEFKIGDAVKVLIKKYSNYESHFGMIVAFDEFRSLPTIVVAYLDPSSWEVPLKMVYVNAKNEDVEICAHDRADFGVSRADIIEQFNRQIEKKKQEIRELEMKEKYFVEMFGKFFEKNEQQSAG